MRLRDPALLLVFAFVAKLPAADLSGEAILRLALDGETHQEKLRQQYIWHEHVESGPAKADGSRAKVEINRDFDITFLNGAFYRQLVAVNGKPVKAGTTVKQPPRHIGVPLAAVLSVMDQKLLREEEIDGHKYRVVQSDPKKNPAPATPAETEALSYRYTHWIDQEDKSVLRVEWEVIGAGIATKPGSRATVVFAKQADSVWLPKRAELLIATGDRFGAKWVLQTNDYSAYMRFTTDTSIQFDAPR